MSSSNTVLLRRITAADIPVIAEFEREIAEISFPDNPVTDVEFYSKKLRSAIQDRKSWPMVAEIDGAIIGWVWFVSRENFVTRDVYADLRSFYIAADRRGSGEAFGIMRQLIEEARRLGFSRLVGRTAATNRAMQSLYLLYGYEPQHVVYELDLAPDDKGGNRGGDRGSDRGARPLVDFGRPGGPPRA